MVQNISIMIIGFVLLIKGADFVVKGAVGLSKRLNLSEMLIGIVLVGIGTSLPEILVTITSSLKGEADIVLGNAIGSSICNILLVLGLAAFIRPLKIDKRLCKTHLPMSLLTVIALFVICNFGDTGVGIQRAEGIILITIAVIYTIFTFFEGKNQNEDEKPTIIDEFKEYEKGKTKMSYLKIFSYILLGIVGLKFGSDFVIDEATNIANYFAISPAIISMTVIAVGTALPEIATSVVAAIRKDSDLAVGNIVGSNIYNICLLPGIGTIINPIKYDISFNNTIIVLAIATLLVLLLTNIRTKTTITRRKAFLLLLLYCAYLVNLFA